MKCDFEKSHLQIIYQIGIFRACHLLYVPPIMSMDKTLKMTSPHEFVTELATEEKDIIWKIKNFTEFQKAKREIRNPEKRRTILTFTAGESLGQPSIWYLEFTFSASTPKMGLYFSLKESFKARNVCARLWGSIKDPKNPNKVLLSSSMGMYEYTPNSTSSWQNLMAKDQLELEQVLFEDTLTIHLKIKIYGDEMHKNINPPNCPLKMLKQNVRNQMGEHFSMLLKTGESSDFVIRVKKLNSQDYIERKQPDLPKLPVPDLEKTLQRYLEAVQPILSPQQYERVQKLAQELSENEGPELQNLLTDRQMKMQNWAYDWWLNDMYMNNPLCLPINSNPGGVFPPQQFPTVDDQLLFTAKLVTFMMDFRDVLDRRDLPVEKAASREPGQPLCMAQHYRLFTSYRVPSIPRDFRRDTSQLVPDHIVVAYKKHFFTCPIKTAERRLTTDEICGQLKRIVESETSNNETPIGILTSQKRPVWADERIKLLGDDINKQSIDEIETCHFIVCLDDPLPGQYFNSVYNQKKKNTKGHWVNDRDETNMLHHMLHGGGSIFNTGNRWFDKTLQFVISSDGIVGLCYEHSSAEGIGILNIMDEFFGKINKSKNSKSNANGDVVDAPPEPTPIEIPLPIKLEWTLAPDTKIAVREACVEIDGLIQDLDLMVFRFQSYGKDFIKKCKVSPDVYIQLALQLAYFTLHGKMVATYESGSTRRYKLGRVDCIRSTTIEALEWVKSMQAGCTEDSNEKMRKFHHAVEKQTNVMVENILGEGIDVHLLGLRQQAAEIGKEPLKIFEDETFQIANHFALSTSQLPTKQDQFMGYGAVVSDGYGASYNPQNDCIVFCLASFRSDSSTSTLNFSQSLQQSLDLMKKVLE